MDKEQEYFLAGIRNQFALCEKQGCPRFSAFLTEEQQAGIAPLIQKLAKGGFQTCFWGGYADAARKMLGVFPDYIPVSEESFPIAAFTACFPARPAGGRAIGHRDVLGTLMAQQIKREMVGDIIVLPERAVFFLEERLRRVAETQIDAIGGVGVTVGAGFEPFEAGTRFEEVNGTLKSLRLDAAAALCAGCSREKAAAAIAAGLVSLNHIEKKEPAAPLKEGDILIIRGKGKFKLGEVGGLTRKGRLAVVFLKYL